MEKITLTPLDESGNPRPDEAIAVLFNPASYTVGKTVGWSPAGGGNARALDAPPLTFNGGGARTLTLELFYDISEAVTVGNVPAFITDVRELTNKVAALTRLDAQGKAPPVVEVSWGDAGPANSDFPFQGVVTGLTQTFTLFEEDGTALRATLSVSLLEFRRRVSAEAHDALRTVTREVRAGDRLEGIAAQQLGDPAAWRAIARANGIADPRRLTVGERLSVPKS